MNYTRQIGVLVSVMAMGMLAGCNTLHGVGSAIQGMGSDVQDASNAGRKVLYKAPAGGTVKPGDRQASTHY